MQAALLPDRGIVKVAGDDARRFLNGLATNNMDKVGPGHAIFTALLTPQFLRRLASPMRSRLAAPARLFLDREHRRRGRHG